MPPEAEEVEEPRPALAAADCAWASARAACIVANAVETGTPGAWKHPFTKVPTAWSTTLGRREHEKGNGAASVEKNKNEGGGRGGLRPCGTRRK